MPFPLLALGILAGNELLRQYKQSSKEEQVAERYRGLLGTAPTEMGPPTADGQMAQQPGTGLLADPGNIGRQMQFAAGIAGLPGQQTPGINLLNSAFQRAQQEAQNQQQAGQWQRSFDRQGDQFDRQYERQGQQFGQTFQAGRDDAAAAADRFALTFGAGRQDAARQAQQWGMQFGAGREDAAAIEERFRRTFGLQQQEANAKGAPGMPKLEAGYQWVPAPDGKGGAIAAPIAGTQDYAKGVGGLETLNGAIKRIGQMRDLVEGKITTTKEGNKVRTDGAGTEFFGETAAQMGVLRGQIISDMAKLNDMGVLQEGEYDRLAKLVRDPTSMGAWFTKNKTTGAGYETLAEQFRSKAKSHLKANPWLVPTMPAGFKPAEE